MCLIINQATTDYTRNFIHRIGKEKASIEHRDLGILLGDKFTIDVKGSTHFIASKNKLRISAMLPTTW